MAKPKAVRKKPKAAKPKVVRKKLKVVKLKNQEEPKEVTLEKRPLKNVEDGGKAKKSGGAKRGNARKAPAQKRRR